MDERERRWVLWMQEALAGDAAAYERLLRELAPAIRSIVLRQLGQAGAPVADCEDIVQDTLLALHLKRHTWRVGDPLGPWLRTIARHKLIDRLRRSGRRAEVPVDAFAELLPAPEQSPDIRGREVERHLARLPARQQDIIRSIAVEGASVGETAARLKMTPGAVRVTLHRAFASLSRAIRASEAEA